MLCRVIFVAGLLVVVGGGGIVAPGMRFAHAPFG